MAAYNSKKSNLEIEKQFLQIFKTDLKKQPKLGVDFQNIDKVYENGIMAVHNFNLKIKPGQFVVLLGPSGCGKTTVLRMIAGLESVSNGYLKFNNVTVNAVSPKDRNIAMVFQNYALYPFMTVYNNIAFGLKNKARRNARYKEIKEQIRVSRDPNYLKIRDNKAKLKILSGKTADNKDEIANLRRSLKIAQINKEPEEIKILREKITKIKAGTKSRQNSTEDLSQVNQLKNENKTLKTSFIKRYFSRSEQTKKLLEKRRELMNVWKKSIPLRIENVTKMLGIQMFTRRKPAELSGGQRQRVALSRAISKQAGLFLYDEPLSNLDAKLRGKMRTEIRDIHDTLGATSVYVTHDQIEAMSMADKIVVMNRGFIQQIGTPLELIESPFNLFVAKFIGNTDINLFEASYLKDGKFALQKTKSTLQVVNQPTLKEVDWNANKTVYLAFRPEHVIVNPEILDNYKTNKFTGSCTRTELLGNDFLVSVKTKELGLVNVIYPSSYSIKVDDKLTFAINMNRINIYDMKYGYNLLSKDSPENIASQKNWIAGQTEREKNQILLVKQKNHLTVSQRLRLEIMALWSKVAKERLAEIKRKPELANEALSQ